MQIHVHAVSKISNHACMLLHTHREMCMSPESRTPHFCVLLVEALNGLKVKCSKPLSVREILLRNWEALGSLSLSDIQFRFLSTSRITIIRHP